MKHSPSILICLVALLLLAITVEAQQTCSAGQTKGCADNSQPSCPDGSAPSKTAPPCTTGSPTCANGAAPVCLTSTGTTPDTSTADSCSSDGSGSIVSFAIDGVNRIITTDGCPNHEHRAINPNSAKKQRFFGAGTDYKISLPVQPSLAPAGQEFNVECVGGAVGVARSGPMIFSPYPGTSCPGDAVALEGSTFDECGGHSAQRGDYHYHMTPKCTLAALGDVATAHSPLLGYMADGIPIYGPRGANGAIPKDLDACGGHASDEGNGGQYHYHFQPITGTWPDPTTPLSSADAGNAGPGYPYTVKCLKGCIPDNIRNSYMSATFPSMSYADCVTQGTLMKAAEHVTESIPSTSPPGTPTTPQPAGTTTPVPQPSAGPNGVGNTTVSGAGTVSIVVAVILIATFALF